MKRRCCAPNSKEFSRYGAIRITVCDRWLDEGTGYQSFLEDMGDRPPGTTLDGVKLSQIVTNPTRLQNRT